MHYPLSGKTVLITGGGSGIGKIMGRKVLERGAKLLVWDISADHIAALETELKTLGEVHTWQMDISDKQQIITKAKEVLESHEVDILINNAGIIVGKHFQDHTVQEIYQTMEINANAPMYIAAQFLPGMLKRQHGSICNIASSAGLISNPKMSVYVASKWSLTGWSDSLRIEMEQLRTGVGVTTVTPYYINTGMFDGVKSLIPILDPEKTAEKIIRGIEKGKVFVSMPWSVRFVRLGQALFPIWFFDWFIGKVLGVYSTMEHFTGRIK